MADFSRVLFVGAVESELSLLKEKFHTHECGIGNIDAALSLGSILSQLPVEEVIFLGTAGSYAENAHDIYFSSAFHQFEIICREGGGKKPDSMNEALPSRPGPAANYLQAKMNLPASEVNCPGCITLRRTDSFGENWLENLEAYGLARAAEKNGVYFSAFMPVTNRVNEQGSMQWRKNHRIMSERIQKKILDLT